jgi:hypothetical protein
MIQPLVEGAALGQPDRRSELRDGARQSRRVDRPVGIRDIQVEAGVVLITAEGDRHRLIGRPHAARDHRCGGAGENRCDSDDSDAHPPAARA